MVYKKVGSLVRKNCPVMPVGQMHQLERLLLLVHILRNVVKELKERKRGPDASGAVENVCQSEHGGLFAPFVGCLHLVALLSEGFSWFLHSSQERLVLPHKLGHTDPKVFDEPGHHV